jgi:hypothetical protein
MYQIRFSFVILSCPFCGASWFNVHCTSSYIHLGFTHITLLFVILHFMVFLFPSLTSRILTSSFLNIVSNFPFISHVHTYSMSPAHCLFLLLSFFPSVLFPPTFTSYDVGLCVTWLFSFTFHPSLLLFPKFCGSIFIPCLNSLVLFPPPTVATSYTSQPSELHPQQVPALIYQGTQDLRAICNQRCIHNGKRGN